VDRCWGWHGWQQGNDEPPERAAEKTQQLTEALPAFRLADDPADHDVQDRANDENSDVD
jgi:hypothetical protein